MQPLLPKSEAGGASKLVLSEPILTGKPVGIQGSSSQVCVHQENVTQAGAIAVRLLHKHTVTMGGLMEQTGSGSG